ncbi:MAG: Trans-aconitate 2-methyltransferase [Bacteroidota bacterium]|jgi:hypothetical protein
MKNIIKNLILTQPLRFFLESTRGIIINYEVLLFNRKERIQIEEMVEQIPELQKLEVLNGPFKGMKYPEFLSMGSTLIPKLLGSYEAELHPIIDEIIEYGYEEVWDVGCAEGYYAVGLALMSPTSKIRAYDIDINSRKACLKLVELNNVTNQVGIYSECTSREIDDFDFKNGLIISDCEGYEYELFRSVSLENKSLNFLIEVHEWPLAFNMAVKLSELFSKTHDVQIIESKSDLFKAKNYSFHPVTKSSLHNLEQRFNVFKENRGGNEMIWFYCTKKR